MKTCNKKRKKKAFSNSDGINIHHDIKWTKDLAKWSEWTNAGRGESNNNPRILADVLVPKHVVNNLSKFRNFFQIYEINTLSSILWSVSKTSLRKGRNPFLSISHFVFDMFWAVVEMHMKATLERTEIVRYLIWITNKTSLIFFLSFLLFTFHLCLHC